MSTNSRIGKQLNYGMAQPKGNVLQWQPKSISRTRQDIKSWNNALNMMRKAEDPQNWPMQLLYEEIRIDALVTSQIENRKNQVFSTPFALKKANGEVDEEQTRAFKKSPLFRFLTNQALESIYHAYSLIEFTMEKVNDKTVLVPHMLPRENVVPQTGRFYKDYSDTANYINYRDLPEFGTWLLEVKQEGVGLLNKVVSHVLFRRFAQSCWSELCEIYGIPPRVMKTNTRDTNMLNRATKMMKDMGAASWFIIDETEEFEFAKGVSSNGDVYKNLMDTCRNEICLAISGAVTGQDTKNGSEAKDKVGMEILWMLVQSDMAMLEDVWNSIFIPALVKHGVLKGDLNLEFQEADDVEQLWKFTSGLLTHYKIDPKWIREKFSVEVLEAKEGKPVDEATLRAIIAKMSADPNSPPEEGELNQIESFFKQALINLKKQEPNLFSTDPRCSLGESGELLWEPPFTR